MAVLMDLPLHRGRHAPFIGIARSREQLSKDADLFLARGCCSGVFQHSNPIKLSLINFPLLILYGKSFSFLFVFVIMHYVYTNMYFMIIPTLSVFLLVTDKERSVMATATLERVWLGCLGKVGRFPSPGCPVAIIQWPVRGAGVADHSAEWTGTPLQVIALDCCSLFPPLF